MKIQNCVNTHIYKSFIPALSNNQNQSNISYSSSGMDNIANYNKGLISFKGYCGDGQPVKKMFWILTGRNNIYKDNETLNNLYETHSDKKWVKTSPSDLLKRSPEQAIQSICTLNNNYEIPSIIKTPNYDNNWGRRANYLEINPRTVAMAQGNKKQEGLLNVIKLLPAIPPSSKSYANCIILSQLYPVRDYGSDEYVNNNSLYTMDLGAGISKNLTSRNLSRNGVKMSDGEQVKAFNDLAHLRGLKTGVRMLLSEGQMSINGRQFNWYTDENAYIDACCKAIDLGFDSIYFDSAKHVGDYDMSSYMGVGRVPDYKKMQYITSQIRERTGRKDISFIGERCNDDLRYDTMGLTAGTDWSQADYPDNIMHEYRKQEWNTMYAAGPNISDDNDIGNISLDTRLKRIKNAFNTYNNINYRLPVFMQMTDLFPLSPFTNTHDQMLKSNNFTAFGDIESAYNNIFDSSKEAQDYRMNVYKEFANMLDR